MEQRLIELMKKHTDVKKDGFSIHIDHETSEWNTCILKLGVERAYKIMARACNQLYKEQFHENFLFSDECMENEIAYHVNAYMNVIGYKMYQRAITTHLFSVEKIIQHCKEVDISTFDVHNFRQSRLFRYRTGIRECYKHTKKNPYNVE